MKLMVMNSDLSKISVMFDSGCCRLAYLIANDVVSASSLLSFYINYDRSVDRTMMSKVDLVARYAMDLEPAASAEVNSIIDTYKKYRMIKHMSGKMIVHFKQLERLINKEFDYYMEPSKIIAMATGLYQLQELAKKGEFCYNSIHSSSMEGNIKGKSVHVNAHEILLSVIEPPTEEDLEKMRKLERGPHKNELQAALILQSTFLDWEKWGCNVSAIGANDPDAANSDSLVIEPFVSLSNILFPTGESLETIRKSILPEVLEFNTVANEWIDLCLENNELGFQFFKDKMLPAANAMGHTLEQSSLLADAMDTLGDTKDFVKGMIGLVPVSLIVQYYKNIGVIADATVVLFFTKLMVLGKSDVRLPVFICKMKEKTVESIDVDASVVTLKKSIDID